MGPSFVTPDAQHLLARTPGPAGQWQLHPLAGGAPQRGAARLARPAARLHPRRPRALRLALVGDRALPSWTASSFPPGSASRWTEVRVEDKAGAGPMMPIVMTPDGQSYAFSVHRVLSELYLVRGLR